MWLLLIATVTATFFIQRWHLHYFPPSAAAMLLGMLCGGLVKLTGKAACNDRLKTCLQASGQPHPELFCKLCCKLRRAAKLHCKLRKVFCCDNPLITASMVRQLVHPAAGLERALTFSPVIFFYALLPPIVFAAGFTLKKRDFFQK